MPAIPKLLWGAALANAWIFPGAIDNPLPTKDPVGKGSESEAGNRDWWESRVDYEITLDVRSIPKLDLGGKTGYSTPVTGVAEALAWLARWGNVGRFYADKDAGAYHNVYAIDLKPREAVSREPGGALYRVRLHLRDVDGVAFGEY